MADARTVRGLLERLATPAGWDAALRSIALDDRTFVAEALMPLKAGQAVRADQVRVIPRRHDCETVYLSELRKIARRA